MLKYDPHLLLKEKQITYFESLVILYISIIYF